MLKSLELFGFKSFADRTRFDFSRGITAVVGPNGSGKSNVVDGIKWILGDQSPRSLRGREMTDVIFNGSRNRKAQAFAEATLAFDNSSGFLPVERREVHIGRRLWRSGDSEYLLNGAPVRLKDIRQLLMGSDAGSAAYSIIEQGRVDQILQANAISRRTIFEEAAGINLYKVRRAEFVRRMERVEQTLERLTDIVDEVEARRSALRGQAEKAARFREISNELRRRWLGLAADEFRLFSARIEELSSQIAQDQSQLESIEARRSGLERRLEEIDHETAEVDRRLRDKDREISSLRESIAGRLTTIRLQSGRREEFDAEFLRLKRQRYRLDARAFEGQRELDETAALLDQGERSARTLAEKVRSLEAEFGEVSQKLQQDRDDERRQTAQAEEGRRRLTQWRQEASNLQMQLHAARNRHRAAETRREDLEQKLAELRHLRESSATRTDEIQGRIADAERQHGGLAVRRGELREERARAQSALAELRERRSAEKARLGVLQDLEHRQEGLGIGVKEILRRAKTSDYAPWNGIAGTVADLIEVDLEHAALLEAALGDRAQHIVIRGFGPLAEYLTVHSSQISGRVAFRNRDNHAAHKEERTNPPADVSVPPFEHAPGVVDRADHLVRGVEGFDDLPERVLADTWIVETLELALELSGRSAGRYRFATLQGEVVEADGTLVAGSLRSETAVVSRKSELRQLKNELLRLDRRIEEGERRLADIVAKLADLDERLGRSSTALQDLASELSDAKSEQTTHLRELDRLRDEQQTLRSEIADLEGAQTDLSREIEERAARAAVAERELHVRDRDLERLRGKMAERERERNTLGERRDEQQLLLAKQEQRCEGVREAFQRARREQETRLQQRQEARRRLRALRIKRRDVELAILETRAILAELALAEQRGLDEAERISAEKDGIRARRAAFSREDAELRKEALHLQESMHGNELEVRAALQSRETLVERIAEEYQVELAEVVETGVSAYEEWLKEQRPEIGDQWSAASGQESEGQRADPDPEFEDVRGRLEAHVERLRRKLKTMGAVNTDSLRDLDEIEARYEYLSLSLSDLLEAKRHLEDLVRKIDHKCRQMFRETFDGIRANFQDLFRKAFGGGDGDIVLEDPDDVLECGIDIVARPPGKELKSITLLSGGEKTLTAFALLLALFRYRPSPYCILDEVDAALDEANVERLLALLQEFKAHTQFLIITHKKPTMTIADVLYGVTMEESGVSKRMNVKFENIGEDGRFLSDGPSAAA